MSSKVTVDLSDQDEADFSFFSLDPLDGLNEYITSVRVNAAAGRIQQLEAKKITLPSASQDVINTLEKQQLAVRAAAIQAELDKLPKL